MPPPRLLLAVLTLFVNSAFITAIVFQYYRSGADPCMAALCYACLLLLYTVLYWRRRRQHVRLQCQHGGALLRRGLGYAAVGLASFLSVLFVYGCFDRGVPLLVVIGVGLLLAVVGYCFYRVLLVLLLPAETAEEATAMPRAQHQV